MLTHIRKSPLVFLTPQARLMILRTSLSALPPQQHLQLSKPKLFKTPPYRSQLLFMAANHLWFSHRVSTGTEVEGRRFDLPRFNFLAPD